MDTEIIRPALLVRLGWAPEAACLGKGGRTVSPQPWRLLVRRGSAS
jgi:hypothetical protein